MYLYQTGRQQELSIAEIEALAPSSSLKIVDDQFVAVDQAIRLKHMGGSLKQAFILDELADSSTASIKRRILSIDPTHLFAAEDKKYNFGISCYGLEIADNDINGIALELKKKLKKLDTPRKLRVVPTKNQALSNAQVQHNKLFDRNKGAELVLVKGRDGIIYLAVTTDTQNLDNYTARDMQRPNTDTFVGMLPIKLAQMLINLAKASPEKKGYVLDPFCGLGTVIQECAYAGIAAYGTDISPEMVRASEENLQWFTELKNVPANYTIETGDATSHTWSEPIQAVATEMFLGEPLKSLPSPEKVHELNTQSNQLLTKFLANIHGQIAVGTVLAIATPAWRIHNSFSSVISVDELQQLGYTYASFQHVDSTDLVYIRDNQQTGRRIMVLIKK
ncbi:TPA: hypothetical protein EYO12_00370 [Candidatus Saccharibacteria bacterium]|nr:hypothetical protein [Candidatus Saccharibacteria bacterium]HIO87549.1 hypothetical protein [Candidatus Saccharibacteria bacterium]